MRLQNIIEWVDKSANRFVGSTIYTLLLCTIISTPTLIYYARTESYSYCVYIWLFCFLLSTVVSLLLFFISKKYRCLKLILASILFFVSSVFVIGQLRFGLALPIDSLGPIAQTNITEAQEFTRSNISMAISGGICFLIAVAVIYVLVFHDFKNKIVYRILFLFHTLLLSISVFAIMRNSGVVNDYINCNNVFTLFENSADLRKHLTHPKVIETSKVHPQTIVIIIGESFTKYHSSLYGYGKLTNPCLQQYVDRGDVVVFDSVSSPEVSTTPTFKYLLNTNTRNKDTKWYEATTIQEYCKNAGYHLTWISNQQQFGALNNISSGQSVLCDEIFFHGGEGQTKDMEVVETYKKLKNSFDKNLFFFHLYGQHPEFDKRYPDSFAKFMPSDYDAPSNQKSILAAYDNATLYNDYVVSSIFKCFEDKDALMIYFADHGLDLFYTNPSYSAHGRPSDPKSFNLATQVPFIVFIPERFRQHHPEIVTAIQNAKSVPFCTEIFIYKLLSFMGYKLENDGK